MPGLDVREQDVVGKTVVAAEGSKVGTVKQMAFSLDGRVGFIVEDKQGNERSIPLVDVQGVADFVVLRPENAKGFTEAPAQAPAPVQAPARAVPAAGPAPKPPTPSATSANVRQDGPGGAETGPAPPPGACAQCGKTLKAGARFCGGCGTRVG